MAIKVGDRYTDFKSLFFNNYVTVVEIGEDGSEVGLMEYGSSVPFAWSTFDLLSSHVLLCVSDEYKQKIRDELQSALKEMESGDFCSAIEKLDVAQKFLSVMNLAVKADAMEADCGTTAR